MLVILTSKLSNMRYNKISNNLFKRNRKNLIDLMPDDSAAIFFSSDQQHRNGDQYFPYRQDSDFFYLSGIDQEKSIIIITKDKQNSKYHQALFLIKTNERMARWEGHKYTKEEAKNISGINNIYWLDSFESALREIALNYENILLNRPEYPGFKPEYSTRNEREGNKIMKSYPLNKYHRAAPLLLELRLIKSEEEIELLKTACEITNKGFRRILQKIKPGITEYEIQAEIDHEFTINRSSGQGYAPIIASGKNACVLHYVENNKKCNNDELILFDFGAEYANYSADMSRTIPVNGKFTKRQKDCYNAVLRVQKQAMELYVTGNTIKQINQKVNLMMEMEMIDLGLLTPEEIRKQNPNSPLYKKYFMHGTAHFLGLDVHDVGGVDIKLKPGMVLTCEPGIYIEEENTGIRLENDILVTDNGPVNLMKNIPIEVDDIENLMNN